MRRSTGMRELLPPVAIRYMSRVVAPAIASEDVGNADPRAMQVAIAARIALLALARRKVNAPLLRRLFT